MPPVFKLNKLKTKCKTRFTPQSQIIEFVYCDICDNRETSRLSIGFTLLGCQIFCQNCNKSVLHFELHGSILADPFPQGRFNERAKHGNKAKVNHYTVSSENLNIIRQEIL
jgi:hypothetical protein